MAEWVEKNGHWFDLDYNSDLEDYLRECNVNPQNLVDKLVDVDNLSDDVYEEIGQEYVTHHDGLVGDDFYVFKEGLENILRDLREDIYESLLSNSRKGNTKADIARRLDCILSNFDSLIH